MKSTHLANRRTRIANILALLGSCPTFCGIGAILECTSYFRDTLQPLPAKDVRKIIQSSFDVTHHMLGRLYRAPFTFVTHQMLGRSKYNIIICNRLHTCISYLLHFIIIDLVTCALLWIVCVCVHVKKKQKIAKPFYSKQTWSATLLVWPHLVVSKILACFQKK